MNLKTIIQNKDAVSLLALSQINFNAGLSMMKRLRHDAKTRRTNEDDLRNNTQVADEFAAFCPQVDEVPQLDTSVNLVVATLLLASEINNEETQFLKRNIRSPKLIIESQSDWMADQEAMQRMVTAAKFGLTLSVDTALAQIKGKMQGGIATFVTEAQSAVMVNIRGLDSRSLIHLIEENYHNKDWKAKLDDSAVSLYEGAVKRIEQGKFADLPDELITYAQGVLTTKGK